MCIAQAILLNFLAIFAVHDVFSLLIAGIKVHIHMLGFALHSTALLQVGEETITHFLLPLRQRPTLQSPVWKQLQVLRMQAFRIWD